MVEGGYILADRGELDQADALIDSFRSLTDSEDFQRRAMSRAVRAWVLNAEGRYEQAITEAETALKFLPEMGMGSNVLKMGLTAGLEAGTALGNAKKVEELLGYIEHLRPRELTPLLRAIGARFGAHLAGMRGDNVSPAEGFAAAVKAYAEIGAVVGIAQTQTEHAEWLIARGDNDGAAGLLDQAAEVFEPLRAQPWIERVQRARERAGVKVNA
jgi:tetratricopeptide (TPR) repeat protein